MKVSVELDQKSLNRTLKALDEFGKDAEKVVKDVVNRTALDIETDAKNKLKSDGHIVTGRLRASIHAELTPNESYNYSDKDGKAFDGSLNEDFGELEAIAGTNVEYGPKIEYDYDSFMRFSAEKNKGKFLKRMRDGLNKLIKG